MASLRQQARPRLSAGQYNPVGCGTPCRSPGRAFWLLLPSLLLLAACSSPPIVGMLQTRDNQPLLLSSGDSKLLLTPGTLSAELGEPPERSGSIRLKNVHGEIAIKTVPEDFEYNHFLIQRDPGQLSNALKGAWREETLQLSTHDELEACTAPGICPQTEQIIVCPDNARGKQGKDCQVFYQTRMRYAHNCPGYLPVRKTYQRYVVTLDLEFMANANLTDRLASFQGRSSPQQRVVSRLETGPCLPY